MRRMGSVAFWGTCCVLLALPFAVHAAGEVSFSEILFDPQGTDTGLEWIEIYNAGDTPADLTGWQLYPDGIGYFLFPAGFALAAKSFVVVHLRVSGSNSSSELYHPVIPSKNMGNTAGSVALFSGEPGKDTIKSFVEWGKGDGTWESAAVKAGMWAKGTFVDLAHAQEGNAIALQTLSKTSSAASDWTISVLPTAGAASASSFFASPSLPASAATSSAAGNSSGSSFHAPVSPNPPVATIEAFAGEDRTVPMGTEAEFLGSAIGLVHEPITHARFWWNFGDGETREGKSVGHVFRALGTYVVGLHVSSGDYAASDYLTVSVVPNQIAIGSVVAGEDGYVRLENDSGISVDIGGWILEDDGMRRFIIPVRTVVGVHGAAAFANHITRLFPEKRAALRRPDESLAVSWSAPSVFVSGDARTEIPHEPVETAPPRASGKPRLLPSARHAKEPKESRPASSTAVHAENLAVSVLPPNVFPSSVAAFGAAFALSAGAAIGLFCLRRMIS